MARGSRHALGAVLLVALASMPAAAYRPLLTEDTGTVDRGQAEVQLGVDVERADTTDRWSTRAVLALGVAQRFEARVDAGALALAVDGERGRAGLADTVIGAKYRLLDESLASPALLAAVSVRLPTGEPARGLGDEEVDVTALAVLSTTPGPVSLMLNLGRTFVTRDAGLDTWVANLAADYRLAERLSAVAEVVSTFGARDRGDVVLLRGGVLARLSRGLSIDGGLGVGLTRAAPDFQAALGFTYGF